MPENPKITNQNEFEVPMPQRKNDDITTGNAEKTEKADSAQWQKDKLNEANNEPQGVPVDSKGGADEKAEEPGKEAYVSDKDKEKGSLGDTSKDSIVDKPKTETYQKEEEKKPE